MGRLLTATAQDVMVVDRAFGLVDEGCIGEGAPGRLPGCAWVRASAGSVFLETSDMALRARLRVEVWDAEAAVDEAYWPGSVRLSMHLPTARFIVDESDAGWEPGPRLPSPGRWGLRVGRREPPQELPWEAAATDGVEACFLLQFWPEG
jgi:hypothetical protein